MRLLALTKSNLLQVKETGFVLEEVKEETSKEKEEIETEHKQGGEREGFIHREEGGVMLIDKRE